MRVLLDENLPRDLGLQLESQDVLTVQGLGWAGVANGELLGRACGLADVFLTMDRKLEREHNLSRFPFGTVIIRARSNRVVDLVPLVPALLSAIAQIKPGSVQQVGM